MLKDIVVKISCLDLAKKFEVDRKIVDALLDAGAKEA
jgi:predicted regulator of amino acid metabolism with ACT domain